MALIKVVCGIIYKDDKIFICRRKIEKSLGGYWEFPGGKVEPNESQEDSLERELREELDMEVKVGEFFKSVVHDYNDFSIELISYFCEFKSCNYNLIDHDRFEWVQTKDLLAWKLAPADIPIAEELIVL